MNNVVAHVAIENIVPFLTVEMVVARIAVQKIIASATKDPIIAILSKEHILATEPVDDVIPARADKYIVVVGADDRERQLRAAGDRHEIAGIEQVELQVENGLARHGSLLNEALRRSGGAASTYMEACRR